MNAGMCGWPDSFKCLLAALLTAVGIAPLGGQTTIAQDHEFNKHIRPILAAKCFACHGPDEDHREADLRLDQRKSAIDAMAIVPGKPGDSELVARILSDDPDQVMPPGHTNKPLSEIEKRRLRNWIKRGAKYQKHWAFEKPRRPQVPSLSEGSRQTSLSNWPRNSIDNFVGEAMVAQGLNPSPEADRYTLVRRLYLDLTGLPPSVSQAKQFVQSKDPEAYEKLVDELLASPRYGEHWARAWLDLARYADTNGYEKDRPRSIWPFRDWVIRALNDDLPYNEFSIAQIAGDMLPEATADQRIATGFHRNTMLNEEGGIDPLEYRYLAMVDRVATTGTVWMGLTTGCAQCHTHKYDPISHRDYFRMMGLLNNTSEPDFQVPDSNLEQTKRKLIKKISDLEDQLNSEFGNEKIKQAYDQWLQDAKAKSTSWRIMKPTAMDSNLPKLEQLNDGSIFSSGDFTKRDTFKLSFDVREQDLPIHAIRIEALPDDRLPASGPGRTFYEGRKGDFYVSEVDIDSNDQPIRIAKATHGWQAEDKKWKPDTVFDGDGSSGWQPGNRIGQRLTLVLHLEKPIRQSGKLSVNMLFERHYVVTLGRFRLSLANSPAADAHNLPPHIESVLASEQPRTAQQQDRLKQYFLTTSPTLKEARQSIDLLRKKIPKPTITLVMRERSQDNLRPTFIHHRGEYLQPRDRVAPGLPEMFDSMTAAADRPSNRLEFANWLVSESNPSVSRIAVNRAWRQFFRQGLVPTSGDFGVQSPPPSHPELLDWLAVEFTESGWSMKKLHRLIVTSATYRQASDVQPMHQKLDPENTWLSRAPRKRMTGEMIRDSSLKASGLLHNKMYGPGVRPPQPKTVTSLAYGGFKWVPSKGKDRYRRSIYTFSKRTAAFAAYTVFDAPTGEICTAKRNQSNTPLQALTVLNDPMYVEMARALGRRTVHKKLNDDQARVQFLFQSVVTRPPTALELDSLVKFLEHQRKRLAEGQLSGDEILGLEQDEKVADATPTIQNEQAAFALLARVVMNLDDAVNR